MTEDRAVSTVLGFVLALGVASLLIVGLLIAASGFLADQRQDTVRNELEVIGQHLAADIAASDRLVRAGDVEEVRVTRSFPTEVTGVSYRIEIHTTGAVTTIELGTRDPRVTVLVAVRTQTPVADGTVLSGGDIDVDYTGTQLEVRNG